MNKYIQIAGRKIGADYPPYVIAELSANHNGDIEAAFEIMKMVKVAGADAIKLQTYTADTLTLKCDRKDFKIESGLWAGKTLHELYEEAHTPWEWHRPLFEKAKELGITIFSSPFDSTAVDLLEELDAPAYKIASFEIVDLALIERVAKTGKPMIMSTGMANEEEIKEAVAAARESGCKELVLLHCVSGYPTPADQYNLATIKDLASRYDVITGLSDHTVDNATSVVSIGLGASLVEKHVTLDREGGGPDDSFSVEPAEFSQLCTDVKTAWQAVGKVNYVRTEAEKGNLKFRRSLYFIKDVKAGTVLTPDHVRSVRPGYGMLPKYLPYVLGAVLLTDVDYGSPVSPELMGLNLPE